MRKAQDRCPRRLLPRELAPDQLVQFHGAEREPMSEPPDQQNEAWLDVAQLLPQIGRPARDLVPGWWPVDR